MKTTITKSTMTESQAKDCVEKIKHSLDYARTEIIALHDREGWKVLGHSSWRECCEKEFGFSRAHGYRLLEAARLNAECLPMGDALNERQARALSTVPKANRPAVLKAVAAAGPVTARAITEAAKPKETIELDRTGHPIPVAILADWIHAEQIAAEILDHLSAAKCIVEKGLDEKTDDMAFREIPNTFISAIKSNYTTASQIRPHAVCPTCAGHGRGKCTLCKGRGFISKFRFETCVPEEIRTIRKRLGKKNQTHGDFDERPA